MVRKLKCRGGVVVTASHNPLPWNGLKFMRRDGIFLNEKQGSKFLKFFEHRYFKHKLPQGVSSYSAAIDLHVREVVKAVNAFAIRRKKLKVAFDGCNGAGSVALVKLLKKLGCRVYAINTDTRLPFPHNPEPLPENLTELCQLVREKKADLGLAVDADADRLAIINEAGQPLGEELTLALAVKFVLSKKIPPRHGRRVVVANLSTSRVFDDVAKSCRALPLRTKVGEVHVAEELKNLKGLIGGEGNGGVIYPPVGFNRDSLIATALVLNYLATSNRPLSALRRELPHYEMVKTKVECRSLEEAQDYLEKVKIVFRGETLELTEGVKVIMADSWIHVRASNTEPIIRIIAEGRDQSRAAALVAKLTG
jgi:phosphomannomutase